MKVKQRKLVLDLGLRQIRKLEEFMEKNEVGENYNIAGWGLLSQPRAYSEQIDVFFPYSN